MLRTLSTMQTMAYSKKIRKYLLILLIAGWAITLAYKHFSLQIPEKHLYHDNRILMGTFWEVTSPVKEASGIVFTEVARLEQLLSKYNPTSEISILNRTGKLKVSSDTFYIIKKSKEFYQLTDGAFDITIAPLVELWGFSNLKTKVPTTEEINSTLKIIGSDKIILHKNDSVVEFKLPKMKIDLGGIAKGFALDCAIKKLKENKINSCLINAGGQVYALGNKFSSTWKIAIKNPRKPSVLETLELNNQSVSTSGDYEQFFLKDGKRYCHIINSKTGYPVNSGVTSVTIIDDSGLNADALSTAVFTLGEDGVEMLKKKFPETKFYIK
ncbi:MAG: FAD:protein FMN transferase [Candidatus Omnitrophota bacterium]|nr:FAD:protein FMN transferase [Candidatus Omnitrophota bacterium]